MTLSDHFHASSWAGPILSWLMNLFLLLVSGMTPLTVIATAAALWYTIERVFLTRAQRRLTEAQLRMAEAGVPVPVVQGDGS